MGDINKNVNLTFTTKDKASAGLKAISKSMDDVTVSTKNATKESGNLNSILSKVPGLSGSLSGSLGGMTGSLSSLALKAGVAGAAIAGLTALLKIQMDLIKDGVKEYVASEEATTKLTVALGYKSQALLDAAEAMQKVTVFDDDAVAGAMAVSAAFIKEEDSIIRINKAAADFATARGIGLAEATDLITKSVASGTNALGRYGIQMAKSGDEAVRLESLLKSIQQAYGGMAESMAKTDSGKLKMLDNELNNIKETVGEKVIPAMILWKKTINGIYGGIADIDRNLYGAGVNTAKGIEAIYNNLAKDLGFIDTAILQINRELQDMPDVERVGYLDTLLAKSDERINKYKKKLEELKDVETPKAKESKNAGIYSLEGLIKYRAELQKIQDMLVNNQVAKGINIIGEPEDPEAAAKKAEDLKKKRLDAQNSLNEELFKLDQEALGKSYEGRLQALNNSLVKEKEKYKQQQSEGLISLADYYKICATLGEAYFVKRVELAEEENKRVKSLSDKSIKDNEDRINNLIDSEQKLYDAKKSIEQQNETNRSNMISSFEDRNQQMMERSMSGRLKLAEQNYLDELTLYKFMLDQKMILQEEYDSMAQDMKIEFNEAQYDITTEELNKWVSATTQAASQITSVVQQFSSLRTQKEIDDIDAQTEANKESAQKYIKNKKLLDKELKKIDKEAEARKKEAAKDDQKMAMIASIINTAQAVSGALTMKPPPLGIAMAIIVGALGAVQTGIIASQAFAQGGIIQPVQGVPTSGDKTQVSANPGEMIINQRQQRNLLAMANGYGGGGGIQINETIVVQGNMDSNAIAELKQHREEWLEMLRDSNKQLKYRGYTYAT